MSWGRRILVWALVIGGLGVSGFVCQRVGARGRFVGAYSSYGSGPKGARALFLLADRLGAGTQRWSQDLARLPQGAMLVAMGGCETGMARTLSRFEDDELTRFVADGGVLLVAGVRHYLPEALPVNFEAEADCTASWRVEPAQGEDGDDEVPVTGAPVEEWQQPDPPDAPDAGVDAGLAGSPLDYDHYTEDPFEGAEHIVWASPQDAPLAGLEAVPMQNPGRFAVDPGLGHAVILSMPDALDMPTSPIRREVGVVVPHGKGHVIVLASASMFQNRWLRTADGGQMFARLLNTYAPNGPVIFDEFHLGVGEHRSLMGYLRQNGATPFLAQLFFVALLLLWRGGARFGGLRTELPDPPAGTASFVTAMGRLFSRANDPAGAIDILSKQGLAKIAAHYHVPQSAGRKLEQLLTERGQAAAAAAVTRIVQIAHSVSRHPGGLAAAARAIDQAVSEAVT